MSAPIIIEKRQRPPSASSTNLPFDASVIILHGLGASGDDFVDLIPDLVQGLPLNLRFVMPHAPVRPLTVAGGEPVPSWYDILAMAETRKVNSEHVSTSLTTVEQLLTEAQACSQQLILAGFSQGGAIALESFLKLPIKLTGCLAMSTYTLSTPTDAAGHLNQHTPLLMQHGLYDQVVPLRLGERSAEGLKAAGFKLEWQTYPMQHQLCLPQVLAIRKWLNGCLLPELETGC